MLYILTNKHQKIHGCTVAIGILVQKQQAISIHSAE